MGMETLDTLISTGSRGRLTPRRRRDVQRNLSAYGFLCAALLCFAFFSWYPIVRQAILSFQKTNFVGQTKWVGLRNFDRVIADPAFGAAWKNTAIFTVLALLCGYVIPFVTA